MRENVAAYNRWVLRPRMLVDVSSTTTATSVLGTDVSMPLLVAPTAFQRMAHPEGEVATARGAACGGDDHVPVDDRQRDDRGGRGGCTRRARMVPALLGPGPRRRQRPRRARRGSRLPRDRAHGRPARARPPRARSPNRVRDPARGARARVQRARGEHRRDLSRRHPLVGRQLAHLEGPRVAPSR